MGAGAPDMPVFSLAPSDEKFALPIFNAPIRVAFILVPVSNTASETDPGGYAADMSSDGSRVLISCCRDDSRMSVVFR